MVRCEHCDREHEEQSKFCPLTGRMFAPQRFFPPGLVLQESYRLERMLSVEGVAVVFEATQIQLDKPVHVRMLVPNPALEGSAVEAALKYARAASATRHRNLLSIDDIGRSPDGFEFLVTEPARGRTLAEICDRESPLVPSRAAWLISELLSGLQVIHTRGVTHRDLRPQEVLVVLDPHGDEVVKLMDLGLHHVRQAAASTREGPDPDLAYLSAEQVRGEPVLDARADIYITGAVLYQLLTGSTPLDKTGSGELVAAIIGGDVKPPSSRIREIPEGLDRAVLTALAPTRGKRHADAAAFRRALRPFRQHPRGATELGLGLSALPQQEVAPELHPAPGGDPEAPPPLVPSRPVELPSPEPELESSTMAATIRRRRAPEPTELDLELEPELPAPEPELELEPLPEPDPGTIEIEPAPPPFLGEIPAAADPPPAPRSDPSAEIRVSQMVERGVVPLDGDQTAAAAGPPSTTPAGPPVGLAGESRDISQQLNLDQPLHQSLHQVSQRSPRATHATGGTLYGGPSRGLLTTRRLLLAVALLVAAVVVYHYRKLIGQKLGLAADVVQDQVDDETVLLLVETFPKRADVYVDGVLQVTKPVQLPRSRTRQFELRVEARGYRSRRMQVKADRTRVVRVVLKRR